MKDNRQPTNRVEKYFKKLEAEGATDEVFKDWSVQDVAHSYRETDTGKTVNTSKHIIEMPEDAREAFQENLELAQKALTNAAQGRPIHLEDIIAINSIVDDCLSMVRKNDKRG